MTLEEALNILKKDRELCLFNPMTGEREPMNDDCRRSAEAYDVILKALPKKGRWLKFTPRNIREMECSECGAAWHDEYGLWDNFMRFRYCPNCGAKMKGDGNETH